MFGRFRLGCSMIVAGALALSACGAPQSPYRTADHWSKEGYEWPPGSGADESAHKSGATSYSAPLAKVESRDRDKHKPARTFREPQISGPIARVATPEPTMAPMHKNGQCLRELRKSGTKFESLSELKGVENPVEIHGGRIGGITFWASDGRALELDCRLALALHRLTPVFRKHGVTKARFSGAYVYRRTRSGRLSHHAHGLAIDLHELTLGEKTLSIEDDFARGVGCRKKNPAMNRLACAMRDQKLFEEFLDPDYNFDHRDHLHIAVPQRGQSPPRGRN